MRRAKFRGSLPNEALILTLLVTTAIASEEARLPTRAALSFIRFEIGYPSKPIAGHFFFAAFGISVTLLFIGSVPETTGKFFAI